ncbi:MAG TPA: DUF4136 domain-containing protein [Polaromonas sp.]|uniref:DUF4136 domain-containing protein n=1 Tax=Polaromonas sp. TaxID=1869339 RepID=UPI002D6E044C|nr:DUF4136 domain-containing protein [Polaromonas sp.]HYW56164.1 DUF4136 domain-containing protein [Polaromonas sp.]
MKRLLSTFLFAVSLAALVSGCGTTRTVHSDITSFARWTPAPPAPGATYRFERLPSQQQADPYQAQLEASAQAALAKVGMQFNPQAAAFSVQISASTLPMVRPGWGGFDRPFGGSSIFIGGGSGGGSIEVGMGFPLGGMDPHIYRRDISIVMRDLRSNAVVYETRAISDDPWHESRPLMGAILDAALLGFPVPPPGPRRVSVEIPR